MKVALVASAVAAELVSPLARYGRETWSGPVDEERNFKSFRKFMDKVDPEKKWPSFLTNYGCHCKKPSDSDWVDKTHGPALDDFDAACLRHRNCLRCVEHRFEGCDSTDQGYNAVIKSATDMECKGKPNTCKRAICECDLEFALAYNGVFSARKPEHEPDEWDRESPLQQEKCVPSPKSDTSNGSGEQSEKACCYVNAESQWKIYNVDRQCCSNNQIFGIGSC